MIEAACTLPWCCDCCPFQSVVNSVATSDVLTSDLMFPEKFLMSDVLATNLMLAELLFFFPKFSIF